MRVWVVGVMAAISRSGMEALTFTLFILRMVATGMAGSTVSPADLTPLPMTPLAGALTEQSARFFLARSSCACAWATWLWVSTHLISGRALLSWSCFMRSRASLAWRICASAERSRLRACVASMEAMGWPRLTRWPSLT